MAQTAIRFRGVVKDGVVVPDASAVLADGATVQCHMLPPGVIPFSPKEQSEFDAWDLLSAEAWEHIDWGEGEIARDSG